MEKDNIYYGRFWDRFLAVVIDSFMILSPLTVLIWAIFGYDALKNPKDYPQAGLFQVVMLLLINVSFWYKTGQTPGKKATKMTVVDAKTFKRASLLKLSFRFCFYFISLISLFGFLMSIFRKDRKALHDILSDTCVIYKDGL